ncbi:MAG: hypothetical protein AB8G99_03870 [Planctomycetaceae bacterium]
MRTTIVLLLAVAASSACAQSIQPGDKKLPLPGEAFQLDGHDAFVIAPKDVQPNTPWVFYAPTLKNLPGKEEAWMIERFLQAGIAIAGIDAGESYGSPTGTELYSKLYLHLTTTKGFNKKPVLLARSRGGLMLYSWAAKNPTSVGGIAGIYPVCNLESYPGLDRACGAFEMSAEQLEAKLAEHNPIDRLAPLAESGVPIHHIHGDSDKVVPLDQNSAIVAARYKALGGTMTLEVVPGQGHNMWSSWFQSQKLVDFVIANATNQSAKSEDLSRVASDDLWLTYKGKPGPGNGKHVVLIAAEQEYRCEQSMPMLARVLSEHHGFDCTVLFSVNENGEVDPTLPAPFKDEEKDKRHRIPGLKFLADADCLIWLSRFMQLPDDQMLHFHNYFDSGKPIIALRTANHGFWGGKPYKKNGKNVSLRDMLGGTFRGHHGGWHREATRGIIVDENASHPILTGVSDIFGPSDVYRCHTDKFPFPKTATKLVLGQPLVNLKQDAEPNKAKEPLPIAWTTTWTGNKGKASKIFHFTMGSARDFENEGVRRLTINATYWSVGLEGKIDATSNVAPVGEYKPLKAGFNYKKLGVQPRKVSHYKRPA